MLHPDAAAYEVSKRQAVSSGQGSKLCLWFNSYMGAQLGNNVLIFIYLLLVSPNNYIISCHEIDFTKA